MKITHSSKITAAKERPWYVVDYKIPDDPESIRREEKRRMQRELADEEDAYDLEHGEGIYSSDVTCAEDGYITDSYGRRVHAPKPVGGDGENYISYFTGHGYAGPQEIFEDAKNRGFSKMYWGSDEGYGFKGMYNGDMYIAYNDAELLPDGYREDALDAERRDGIMSSTMVEGATQEDMQKAFEEYQKKQQEMMGQLDKMQNQQLKKSAKRNKLFSKAFNKAFAAEESKPNCHKVAEDADSIEYVVASKESITATKWMGKYLDVQGNVKRVYFDFDSQDWNEAEQEFEEIIPEAYTACKLLGTAPIGIENDEAFTYIESATRAVNGHLLGEIQSQLHHEIHRYLVDVGGFDDAPDPNNKWSILADDIFVVDVHKDESGAVIAEVRAELGYDSMENLADILNDKVIQKYDPDAYFEQVDPGIMEAWMFNEDIDGATKVTAASPVTDTRDHWLEPEESDLEELPTYQETIEIDIDVDITIADDGSYEYSDPDFAADDSKDGNYYISYDPLVDNTQLRDATSVVEDIDSLLVYLLPDAKGKHHISGTAVLVYDVDGLVENVATGEVYGDDVKVTFNESDSEIKDFKID